MRDAPSGEVGELSGSGGIRPLPDVQPHFALDEHEGIRWKGPPQNREIERRLVEDSARPLIYFNRGGICWDPSVKNLTVMVNSIYNGWRMEEVWLDK